MHGIISSPRSGLLPRSLFCCVSLLMLLTVSLTVTGQEDPDQATPDQVTINFRDAEISSVIESVAEITGRSFVLDPRVSGRVTIIAPNTIDADMLYQAFLSAIQVQGFQAVDDGAVTRIVPFNQAFGLLEGGDNELETRLIPVDHVDAAGLIPVLKPLLSSASRLQAFAETNVLVVTDVRSNVVALVDIVGEMDDPSQAALEIIDLEYISASEAVHIVDQLQQVSNRGLSVVEDSLSNRLIVSGPPAVRATFREMLDALDVPASREGGVEVIYLDYARAENLKPVLDSMLDSDLFLQVAGEGGADGSEEAASSYRVEVDESNNALVIAASPTVIQEIRNVILQLDISRPQVLIEAVIAELSEDQAQRISSQLAYADRDRGGYLTRFDNILSTLLGVGTDGDISDNDREALNQALGESRGGFAVGGSFDRDSGEGFGLLIQALKSDGRTRVLSTPSVVTLDNEEASLSVGQEVPFITGSFTMSNNDSTNPFQTIERQEVGIKLRVQPQISEGDGVRLAIEGESSQLLGDSSERSTADVVTAKSTIQTNVMVRDGDLLVLGGLIDGQFEQTETKVPLLGDIPILGHLFRSTGTRNDETVMMMFIRPTIIRDAETAVGLSRRRYNHLISRDLDQSNGELGRRLEEFLEEQQFDLVTPDGEEEE